MNDYINYIGISDSLPVNIKYFKEELFDTVVFRRENSNPIEDVVSATVDYNINSIKLLNTSSRISNEGKKLTGKKILAEVNLSYTIKYTTSSLEKYLYILKSNITKIVYIVVPKEIDDTSIEDLVRHKKVQLQCFIEDLYVDKRDRDSVYIRTLMLLNANIKI